MGGKTTWSNNEYLLKVDSAGNYMWHQTYGGCGAGGVHQTADGGYVFVGNLQGPPVEIEPGHWESVGDSFARLVKTDPDGNTVWEKTFGGAGSHNSCGGLGQTADGGYIILAFLGTGGVNYASLVRTDPAGTELWRKTYGEDYSCSFVRQTDDGGYIVGGELLSGDAFLAKLAPDVPYSLPTATGTGTATLSPSSGTIQNLTAVSLTSLPSEAIAAQPPGVEFPHGLFEFNITGLTLGQSVTLTITLPSAVPDDAQYWKYGPTLSDSNPHWYQIPWTRISSNAISITLTDGGLGDDDLSANGTIVDQGGPGWPSPSGGSHSAPVFPCMYVGIGAALGAGIVAYAVRRRLVAR